MKRVAFAVFFGMVAHAEMSPVLTRGYDNDRSGDNTNETMLTQSVLKTFGVRRVTIIPVYGDARGIEAQPLILPQVKTASGVHDVMVLTSMANQIRGVDAKTGADIWDVTVGRPIDNDADIDMYQINDHWGVLSTGVIDATTQRVYFVSWVSPDGTPAKGVYFMNVLNVKDGTAVIAPVPLDGAVSGTQKFSALMRKQRASLLMTNVNGRKTIFVPFGTVSEAQVGAAGWVIAFDVASNTLSTSLALSQGVGAGIWMSGQGLAADAAGNLYGVTGNGSFDGATDFGESVLKLQYNGSALKVSDWWSPYSDAARVGQDPTLVTPRIAPSNKLAGTSAPSEIMRMPVNGMKTMTHGASIVTNANANGTVSVLVYPTSTANERSYNDEDLGSAGGTLIEKYGLYVAAGKDGLAYVVKTANMGGTLPADFADMKSNCDKLASPPVWITAYPGDIDSCPQDATTLDFMPWGRTRHIHATPVQYWSPTGLKLFVWGENSALHEWSVSKTGALSYLAQSNEYASAKITTSPGGMPGGFCTLSSNKNATGTAVLWCTIPYGDANTQITQGRLLAYDPEHIVNGTIPVLWDSQDWGIQFLFNKFLPPIVDGGQVYVPNYNGGVDVYAP